MTVDNEKYAPTEEFIEKVKTTKMYGGEGKLTERSGSRGRGRSRRMLNICIANQQ